MWLVVTDYLTTSSGIFLFLFIVYDDGGTPKEGANFAMLPVILLSAQGIHFLVKRKTEYPMVEDNSPKPQVKGECEVGYP